MSLKTVLDVMDVLDAPVTGEPVAQWLRSRGLDPQVRTVTDDRGTTDFLVATVPGRVGRSAGGDAPTTGIIGRLGGIGARPEQVGLVSDGDGAVAALSAAVTLATMATRGDVIDGDVVIATHICPSAPTLPHDPVPFMDSPVSMETMNRLEVRPEMDVVLSVDTTKGNRLVNHKGIALTPTVLQGYLLPVADDLLDIYGNVTGRPPVVLPLSSYDITPYGNGLPHVNSILQPAIATDKPVVGVAITAETAVPGCATGASHPVDIALAVSFCIETAKAVGAGRARFYDAEHFASARRMYGSMTRLQSGSSPS
jgi:Protein of unknown function (DUF1177)